MAVFRVGAPRLLGVGHDEVALRRRDFEVERSLEARLVEAGHEAARVGGLELGEGVVGRVLSHAVEAAEFVADRRRPGDADLGAAGVQRVREREHQLVGGVARPLGHAERRGRREVALALHDLGAADGEIAPVEHDGLRRRGDLDGDAHVAGEALARGIDGQRHLVAERLRGAGSRPSRAAEARAPRPLSWAAAWGSG